MGHAIAYIFASVGHQVSVFEPKKEARDTLIERILEISESLETKHFKAIIFVRTVIELELLAQD